MKETNMKDVLEKLHELAKKPISSRGRKIVDIDKKIITELLSIYREKGDYTLPINFLNDVFGYKDVEKLRTRQITGILNNQFKHMLAENESFYIGTSENSTLYRFTIRATKIEEAIE